MAEAVKSKKSATADRIAEKRAAEREWADVVAKIPELIDPLDLPDELQIEIVSGAESMGRREDGRLAPMMHEVSGIMPGLFADPDAFEEWRKSISVLNRLPVYVTIIQHYLNALGESDGSTGM